MAKTGQFGKFNSLGRCQWIPDRNATGFDSFVRDEEPDAIGNGFFPTSFTDTFRFVGGMKFAG